MNLLKKLFKPFHTHDWKQPDGSYPVHGYDDTPYADSVCSICHITGAEA